MVSIIHIIMRIKNIIHMSRNVKTGNSVREGDRKVLLERITNMKYWEAL